ncbi:FlgD immunoglobulin-like domain containing protein [Candidatus Neomarinimicrobiota bacterium]
MKIFRILKINLLVIFISGGNAFAHVNLVYPEGGESFVGGESITIKWSILIDHGDNDWDLSFSNDGGVSWVSIVLNLPKARNTYSWKLPNISTTTAIIRIVQDNNGTDYEDQSSEFEISSLGIDEISDISINYNLEQNFPNPFNSSTTIVYNLEKPSTVSLNIYDLRGSEVVQLDYGHRNEGRYEVEWDGLDKLGNPVSGGTYIYKLQVGSFVQNKKMILLK